jgi:hypothetical protein
MGSGSINNPDQFLHRSKNKVIEFVSPSFAPISIKVPFFCKNNKNKITNETLLLK